MRRLLPFLVLTLLACGAAACDSSLTSDAARVDGTAITQSSVNADLDAISANPGLRCVITANGAINGAGAGTYSATFEGSRLTSAINTEIVTAALARRHVTVSQLATSYAATQFASELNPPQGSSCTMSGQDVVDSFSPELKRSLIDSQAETDALTTSLGGAPLTAAGVAAFSTAHPTAASLQCLSDIVVKDRATAESLHAAIVEGASFATVAQARSLDSSSAPNGGANGCIPAYDFSTPLSNVIISLPVNTVSAVVPFNGYFVLLKVTSRESSPTDTEQVLLAKGNAAEEKLVGALVNKADVEVDPAYGRWAKVSGTFEVVTNAGPPTKFLGNVSAISRSVP